MKREDRSSHHSESKRIFLLGLSATLTEAVFVYLCICVFVFVYLHVRHLGTLFLRSSYHYLFKNIAHVRSICNFDRSCICVFVYLYLCICICIAYQYLCFYFEDVKAEQQHLLSV